MLSITSNTVRNIGTRQCIGRHFNQHWRNIPAISYNYSTNTDYDYLQRSKLPTDHFQKSLPRLPIPKLPDTCEKYLAAQKPILSSAEFESTEKIVAEFKDGAGQALHDELVALDGQNKHTSFISGPWFDYYLRDRRPVVFNHTPFMMVNDDPRPEYNNRLVRATNILISSGRFRRSLQEGILEPEVFHLNPKKSDTQQWRNVMSWFPQSISWYGAYLYKAFPLDMSQFKNLFNGTRIPRPEKDEIFNDPSGRHVVVFKKGHPYVFDTQDKDGNLLTANEILANVKYIIDDDVPAAEYPIGVFTTTDRDTWAKNRELLNAAGNEKLLGMIDNAHFALCLDDIAPTEDVDVCRNFLHGDGTNRWFDKSFSVVMTASGQTSVIFEHAWGDGVAVLRYCNELYKDTMEKPNAHPDTAPANIDSSSLVQRLDFYMTDELKSRAKEAQDTFDKTRNSLDMQILKNTQLNKKLLKTCKLSPDSFMQLAIQMAYFRQYGETAATYESCSTSAFKHGRTETVRSATMATKNACEMFENFSSADTSELIAALQECSSVHGKLTTQAAMGQGFDRHLFAMKKLAEKSGQAIPALYQDPAYAKSNHIILSTSTLSSPAMCGGGFGAVVNDGYGIGYAIDNEQVGFIVTAYPPNRDITGFLQCMESSLSDLGTVIRNVKTDS